MSQQAVSKLEQSDIIEDATLERLARVLGTTSNVIKNFNEETAFNFINNFHDSSVNNGPLNNHHCTFNPLDEIKELNDEKDELYRALLREKDEKIALLERMMKS